MMARNAPQNKDRFLWSTGQAPRRSRELGQWNFLTWSFFLSQAITAAQFQASAAQVEASSGQQGASQQPTGDSSSTPPISSFAAAGASSAGQQGGESTTAYGEHTLSLLASVPAGHPVGEAGVGILHALSAVRGFANDGFTASSAADLSMDEIHERPTLGLDPLHNGHEAAELPLLLGDAYSGDLTLAIGAVLGDVSILLEMVIAPVDAALNTVTGLASSSVNALSAELAGLTSPIGDTLDAALLEAIGVVASVGDGVTSLVGTASHQLLSGTGEALVLALEQGIGDTVVPQHIVGSAGTLVFPAQPLQVLGAVDALFSPSGNYTHYNLSLNSLGGESSSTHAATKGIGSVLSSADHLIDHLTGSAAQEENDHSTAPSLASSLEDLHLRGLGDGIAT